MASIDELRERVLQRGEHCRSMQEKFGGSYLPSSAEFVGQLLNAAGDVVEPPEDLGVPDDRERGVGSGRAVERLDSPHEFAGNLVHGLLLRLELVEARLDLLDAVCGVSHARTLDDLRRMLDEAASPCDADSPHPSETGRAA